ncbi:DUF2092 domain-containing protein [Novosphingobium sp.]|jgi:hypothetical protein|uniref:DUF2092 domain-containing protein n=1 Tax=Novosphingobium sp. TaxID=1874826 RepID=UPI003D6D6075
MPVSRFRPAAGAFTLALLLAGAATPALAQAAADQTPSAADAATTAATSAATGPRTATQTLDPVAIQALKGMGNYLKTLQSFEIQSKATMESTLQDTDIAVHLGYEATYKVMRPTAFFVQLKSDRAIREYYYDGKSLTVNVPRQNYYAKVPAPATIRQTVDKIYLDYGIDLPLADLFYWSENPVTDGITSAVRVGFARINGQETDQFAYRGEDLDWQLWIARGKKPVPLKVVIIDRSNPIRPSYVAELTWNTAPALTARDFAFVPGKNATAIQLAALSSLEGN